MKKRPLPPRGDRKAPPEHDEARRALVESLALRSLMLGATFHATVTATAAAAKKSGWVVKRIEIEEALRRAEDKIREDLQNHDRVDRARCYRRLTTAAQKAWDAQQQATSPRDIARLTTAHAGTEAKLAQLMGWNEPERVRITVVNDAERLRKAFEGLDEERIAQLAARALRERDILERADRYLKAIPAVASIGDVDDGSA